QEIAGCFCGFRIGSIDEQYDSVSIRIGQIGNDAVIDRTRLRIDRLFACRRMTVYNPWAVEFRDEVHAIVEQLIPWIRLARADEDDVVVLDEVWSVVAGIVEMEVFAHRVERENAACEQELVGAG